MKSLLRETASLILLTYWIIGSSASATELEARRACARVSENYYSAEQKEDIAFYCALPEGTKHLLPDTYWLKPDDYEQSFLLKQPKVSQAPRNMGNNGEDDARVSQSLNNPNACQFYSLISPSVQSGRVSEKARLSLVAGPEDLLAKCESFADKIHSGKMKHCSVIEMAGHSTQSVGLDTVIGIDYSQDKKQVYPDSLLMNKISKCFKEILERNGGIIFSSCGGEKAADGAYRYWKNKAEAQQELSNILQLPIISGIGPVHFASKYGANGTEAVGGWTSTSPLSDPANIANHKNPSCPAAKSSLSDFDSLIRYLKNN